MYMCFVWNVSHHCITWPKGSMWALLNTVKKQGGKCIHLTTALRVLILAHVVTVQEQQEMFSWSHKL